MEHVPALPLEDAAHRQALALLVDAAQHAPLPQALAERLGGDGEAVADVVAEALCGGVGGIRIEPERIAFEPAHPLTLWLIRAVGVQPPPPGAFSGVGTIAVGAGRVC